MQVKEYLFADMVRGKTEAFCVSVSQDMIKSFCQITGDVNPLHIDDGYAVSHGYPGTVSYGMLTASFYSTLVGVYLPGKYCLLQSCDVSFNAPAFANDELTVTGTVAETHEVFKRIVIKAEIRNQHGKRISRATICVGMLEPVIGGGEQTCQKKDI